MITDAGGIAEISWWCKPPVTITKCGEPRQGRRNGGRAISAAPIGLGLMFVKHRWFAPPANVQCPFGTGRSLRRNCGSAKLQRYALFLRRFAPGFLEKTDPSRADVVRFEIRRILEIIFLVILFRGV